MKEIDEKYLKRIYLNVLKAIVIILYFLILNLAYKNISSANLEKGIQILTMIFLFISIYIFEKAYKKDDGNLAIQGIEILVLSAYTLTTKHITNKFNFSFESYSLVASYIYAIYFIFKCIIVYTKGRKELAENFSDIKEIVKKDKPIKREATKKISKNNDNMEKKTNKVNKETKEKTTKTKRTRKINEDIEEKPTKVNKEEKEKTTKTKRTRKINEDIEEKPKKVNKEEKEKITKTKKIIKNKEEVKIYD